MKKNLSRMMTMTTTTAKDILVSDDGDDIFEKVSDGEKVSDDASSVPQ